jgi:hypothetical protein
MENSGTGVSSRLRSLSPVAQEATHLNNSLRTFCSPGRYNLNTARRFVQRGAETFRRDRDRSALLSGKNILQGFAGGRQRKGKTPLYESRRYCPLTVYQ